VTGFIYFATYTYFTSTYFQYMPNAGKCAGEEFAAISGCVIISSYLVLFIGFYLATYKSAGKRAAKRAVEKGAISLDPKFTDDALISLSKSNENAQVTGSSLRSASPGGPSTRSRKA